MENLYSKSPQSASDPDIQGNPKCALALAWSPFDKMRGRHEELMKKFPNRTVNHGIPFSGISNLRPESKKAQKLFRPFDRLWDGRDMAR